MAKNEQRAEKLAALQQAITAGLKSGETVAFNMDYRSKFDSDD